MKITTTRKALASALDALARVIPTRSSDPKLTSMHAQISSDTLILTGTNLDVDLELRVPVESSGEAAFTVPAHLFRTVIAGISTEIIQLRLDGPTLHIEAGGSRSKLTTGFASEWPTITLHQPGEPIPVPSQELIDVFGRVRSNIVSEPYNAIYKVVMLELLKGRTRAVASDGHRITFDELETPAPVATDMTLLIPNRSLDQLLAVLASGETTLYAANGVLTAASPTMRAQIRLLDGEYPVYERVIPKNLRITAQVPVAVIAEAISRVEVFSDRAANNATDLEVANGRISLRAGNEYGEAEEAVEATLSGEESTLAVRANSSFFRTFLKVAAGDVRIALSGTVTPYVMTCTAFPRLLTCGVTLK